MRSFWNTFADNHDKDNGGGGFVLEDSDGNTFTNNKADNIDGDGFNSGWESEGNTFAKKQVG